MKNARGFTLIELMIVVAIVAIILTIAVPAIKAAFGSKPHTADQAAAQAIPQEYKPNWNVPATTGVTTTCVDGIEYLVRVDGTSNKVLDPSTNEPKTCPK